jgi:hypothetical protein
MARYLTKVRYALKSGRASRSGSVINQSLPLRGARPGGALVENAPAGRRDVDAAGAGWHVHEVCRSRGTNSIGCRASPTSQEGLRGRNQPLSEPEVKRLLTRNTSK